MKPFIPISENKYLHSFGFTNTAPSSNRHVFTILMVTGLYGLFQIQLFFPFVLILDSIPAKCLFYVPVECDVRHTISSSLMDTLSLQLLFHVVNM